MKTSLFLQSEMKDPYKLYNEMLLNTPVLRDESNNLWVTYTYKNCETILTHSSMEIPGLNNKGLNEYALAIAERFARLRNVQEHEISKYVALQLFKKMQPVSLQDIL